MVMQLSSSCLQCEHILTKGKEYDRFMEQYSNLSADELSVALMVLSKELLNVLAQYVPCVGCRRRLVLNS